MLYRGTEVCDLHIKSKDGSSGKIKDFYFDDRMWTVRYLVVAAGSWLNGHDVLIAPEALTGFNADAHVFTTALTEKEISASPTPESDLPVSRQYEERLRLHYGWNSYWSNPTLYPWGGMYTVTDYKTKNQREIAGDRAVHDFLENHGNIHLRSFREVRGYGIHASDGDIGKIVDLMIEPETWRATHFIVDTATWWPGRHVVIDKGAVRDISWDQQRVTLNLDREEIKAAPTYSPGMIVDEPYQRDLSSYYGQFAAKSEAGTLHERIGVPPPHLIGTGTLHW